MIKSKFFSLAVAAGILTVPIAATATYAAEQLVALPTYRVGPYASAGGPWFAGSLDYYRYINEVEGGINGVKLNVKEYETEWNPDRAVEVYERIKNGVDGSPLGFFITYSTPTTYALADRARRDKIPLIDGGGGRPESRNGLVFPYEFPLFITYYSQATVAMNYIADQFGGYDKLAGKKIVTVYHDSGYGLASQPVMTELAKKYGFEDIQIPVAHPGSEQAAIWRQVREIKPDYVVLRTWGVMTPVAIKTAKRFGIAIDRMLGDVWAGSEDDIVPAENAAKGYCAIAPFPGGTSFEIHTRLKEKILDQGKSDLRDLNDFGSVYYNIGIGYAVATVEAMRAAMSNFGNKVLNGEEMQWGLEHLKIDNDRLKELGMVGLLQPLDVKATDHEGAGGARIQCWDGEKFHQVTDFIKADTEIVDQVTAKASAAYAEEHQITPRALEN